ncbi:MAG: hypothetical protein WDN26_02270 [Chitinophagaceae bacterium]
MSFWFLFTNPKNLIDPQITVRKIRMTFLINGSKRGELISEESNIIDLSESLSKATTDSQISPILSLEGNLVELLKISLK